ncbi:ABC transporter substrate-binding protein [Vibrio aphrogenes]|uniref:ABC transporter substrate-binding protein n=1 Tax=Vibrio aphrogenes TaxID=1891186 RepID=UPI000B34EC16|nr:ABC transporter substrate-binding protein [Vibrio aphrogenes]
MKKILTLASMCMLMFAGAAQSQEQKVVRLASDFTYPPFNYKNEQGQPTGFDIEIADALCKEANFQCVWVSQDWDGLIPALLARKADVIMASMRITEERKKRVLFTHKYYQTPARFVAKKNADYQMDKAGLTGKNIGVQLGTIHDTYVTEKFGDVANIKRYKGQDEVYLDLASGRLDVAFSNADQLQLAFLDKPLGKEFELAGAPVTDKAYVGEGTALALRKQDKQLADAFNQAIETIRQNGTYEQIASKYFNFDIYGD